MGGGPLADGVGIARRTRPGGDSPGGAVDGNGDGNESGDQERLKGQSNEMNELDQMNHIEQMNQAITIPILPCRGIDETLEFYVAVGFEVTYKQGKPNSYACVRL